ncbi:MAG: lipopolysaccharide biosynthesis protein [Lachnospiraceae bacterium]
MGKKYINLFRTIIITGIAFILNCGINLVLTPYITENVGTDAYGFVSLAKQFAQYAVIITTALNSFASRHIAVAYHKEKKSEANQFFSSTFFGDVILGSGILAIALFCIIFLEYLLNIPDNIVADIKILFLLVFINFWITTVFSVYGSASYIKNKLDAVGVFKGISYITEALVLVITYVLFPARVHYVGLGLIAASMVIALSNVWISKRYTPDLKITKENYSHNAVKRLVVDGIWTSVNSLGGLLNNGLDLIVCNLMLSSLAMGQLAIAKTIHSIFQSLFSLVSQAFQPMFLKSYADRNTKNLLQELKFSMKLSGMLANIGFAGFVALGIVYYKLWTPNQDIQLLYNLTVITILTSVPGGPMYPLYYIYTLTVKKKIPCFVTIIGGLCNVIGMYFLIKYTNLGVYVVVLTTAIVMAVINFITNPLYMAHVLNVPWYTFYSNIVRNVISCFMLTISFKCFSLIYLPTSWITLAVCVVIYAVFGSVIHLLIVLEPYEWRKVFDALRRKLSNAK